MSNGPIPGIGAGRPSKRVVSTSALGVVAAMRLRNMERAAENRQQRTIPVRFSVLYSLFPLYRTGRDPMNFSVPAADEQRSVRVDTGADTALAAGREVRAEERVVLTKLGQERRETAPFEIVEARLELGEDVDQ